jgi:amidase
MTEDLPYLSLLDVSDRLHRRECTSVEVTGALLTRIERLDPQLRAVQFLLKDTALEQARQADRELDAGFWRGPLHGVPIGFKDNLWTKDGPTSCGMASRVNNQHDDDATAVKRLKEAGAVLLAKLVLTEGAKFDHDPALPRPNNPWSAEHWPGISSTGCGTAVSAGFVYGAVGMDSGGSIRVPSSVNNVTGIKPSWGRISRYGVYDCSPSFDTPGTFARDVAGAAAILQAISGSDPLDITALPGAVPDFSARLGDNIRGATLGIDWSFATGGGIDQEVVQAVVDAVVVFEGLGVRVQEVTVPWGLDRALSTMPMIVAELTKSMNANFPEAPFAGLTGRGGDEIDPFAVINGYHERDRLAGAMASVFEQVDFIIAPGIGETVPTWAEVNDIATDLDRLLGVLCRFTAMFNLAGLPTVSLPAGFSKDGLPIGIQLASARLGEVDLLRAGAAFQRVTDHHTKRPSLR